MVQGYSDTVVVEPFEEPKDNCLFSVTVLGTDKTVLMSTSPCSIAKLSSVLSKISLRCRATVTQ